MGLYEEYLSHNATSPKIEVDYIDLDPDVLVHFKYIRKEFKNGKWRYYYNKASKVKEFIDTKITGQAYRQHENEVASAKNNLAFENARKESQITDLATQKPSSDGSVNADRLKKRKQLQKEIDYNNKKQKALTKVSNSLNHLANNSLKGQVKSLINAGKEKVKNALTKLANKL